MNTNVFVRISGRVQGVWFRANTKQKAEQLGVTGWIRNTSNGCIEAIFEGDENMVKEMLDWCNHGPAQAKVENVEIKNQPVTNAFDGFAIKY
ncbi:MAG: acylphosphatase [Candidatus Thermoplasmatota archaeon]|nr:acylphosphatase [Candidatus Thermoplasmatota archaeon]